MKRKFIELLAYDRNHQLQYEGKCNLRIDKISSMLFVEPVNQEYKIKSATFKWNFVMDKNMLFVFADQELNDFALVFNNNIRCKKVYELICDDNGKSALVNEMFCNRFLTPFCKMIVINKYSYSRIKNIIKKWIDNHESEEKEEYTKVLKQNNVYEIIYSLKHMKQTNGKELGPISNNVIRDCYIPQKEYRKRRFHLSNSDFYSFKKSGELKCSRRMQKLPKHYTKIIYAPLFMFVNAKINDQLRGHLLIFTNADKTHCYEFVWGWARQLFYCKACRAKRKDVTAISDRSSIKMEDVKHVCAPIPYVPANYIEMKIIKKPHYEILEKCNTVSGRMLVIFDENDKSKCWEFRTASVEKKFFNCRQCVALAKLWNEATEDEYIELRNVNHTCISIPYEPKKYYQFNEFILQPDFEVLTVTTRNSEERKKLIIFDKSDRSLCYVYSLYKKDAFRCGRCMCKGKQVTAKMLTNSDVENYVILSKIKHVCKIRFYDEFSKKDELILRPPNFKLMENTENGVKKIFIFDSNDRSLCYVYSEKRKGGYRYICLACAYIKTNKDKNMKEVSLYLYKDKSGENYVKLDNRSHACKPKKYEPEKYAKKEVQKCYDCLFFRPTAFPNSVNVALYHPKDQSLCYRLNYNKTCGFFRCNLCHEKRRSIVTRIEKDEDGKEFFIHDYKKHVCQPMKVSSICGPEFVILQRNKIQLKYNKINMLKINDSKIVKLPNFELHPNEAGVPDAQLFIFHSEDRKLGYRYTYTNTHKIYRCCCRRICTATARLRTEENDEKYIILGNVQHKCKPMKYDDFTFKGKIINASDIITFSQNDNEKITKIIVFTTPERDECYEFSLMRTKNTFKCLGCNNINKSVLAKLCKDENDQQFFQMMKEAHFCTPRMYDERKYVKAKIITK